MITKKSTLSPFQKVQKRLTDIILGILLMVILAPIFLYIILYIKFTSKGPALYKYARIGENGKQIYCYKFRTMFINPEEFEINKNSIKQDPRYTPIGRFLRVTALDELPQIFNIIEGDMSIVGPRAMLPSHYKLYSENFDMVDNIKPGLTGPTQIKLFEDKNLELTIEEIINIENNYISNWSLWLDLKIIFKSIIIGFSRDGGY